MKINLNIGSGVWLLPHFINVDSEFSLEELQSKKGRCALARIPKTSKFVKADAHALPFPDNHADYLMAMYMIEHIKLNLIIPTLIEWRRVLKPGGEMYFATTNFDSIAQLWSVYMAGKEELDVERYVRLAQVIYGLQVTDGEHHRTPFNTTILNYMMGAAGWTEWNISIYPPGHKAIRPKGYFRFDKAATMIFSEIHIRAVKGGDSMPLTKTGKKVLKDMKEEYGEEKGESVFHASINKGKAGTEKWHGKEPKKKK